MGNEFVNEERDSEFAFALPIQGLYADLETGQSFVCLDDEFGSASDAIQIEVLAGWRRGLNEQFERKLTQMFRTMSKAMPGVAVTVRLEGFLSTCAGLGIECSDALVRRLAQE